MIFLSLRSKFSYLPLSISDLWFETLNLVIEILDDNGNFNKYVSIFKLFLNIL